MSKLTSFKIEFGLKGSDLCYEKIIPYGFDDLGYAEEHVLRALTQKSDLSFWMLQEQRFDAATGKYQQKNFYIRAEEIAWWKLKINDD